MVCYRRRGHNEGDDPSMTQPLMYNLIEAKRSVRKLYTEALIGRGDITVEEAEQALRDYQEQLERVFAETRDTSRRAAAGHRADVTAGLDLPLAQQARPADRPAAATTAVDLAVLKRIGDAHVSPPRASPSTPSCSSCWSAGPRWSARAASTGASASCSRSARCCWRASRSGSPARTPAAAPSCSGTPSSPTRVTGAEWTPLANLSDDQAKFWIYDSLLTEYAAMGFEYGYSVERPDALVLWEAQFGDFANGAQTIVDEFISSARAEVGPAVLASCCCCRTATRARARTTPPAGSSASCSCAPRTT